MKMIFKVFMVFVVTTNISQASGQRRPPRHPPQEAILACTERDEEDECEFTREGRVLSGTCFSPSGDLPLACKPYGDQVK